MTKEYYSILEVSESASPDEIKKAYRKKAMELHPDRHGGDKAKEAEFKKLNEAYSTLSDPQKKAHYDRFGNTEGMGGGFGGFGGGFQGGFDASDLGDIFSTFFGGGFGGASARQKSDVGDDIEVRMKISLEDVIRGNTRKIEYTRQKPCETCHGSGGETVSCDACNGSGQIREQVRTVFGVMEQARACHVCGGTGQKIIKECSTCHGKKYIREEIRKEINVPQGIEDGMSIKMRGEGHIGRDAAGDLYITFSVPDREGGLERDGANLHYTVRISPALASLGGDIAVEIPILGKKVLTIRSGTQGGDIQKFAHEGLVRLDRKNAVKGDLLIHYQIDIPTKLSAEQKKVYQALLELESSGKPSKKTKGFLEGLFD